MAISFLSFDVWVEKAIETYKLAVTARDYADLDGAKSPIFRCRTYLCGATISAVASFAFLLFTLNLNALNIERAPSRSDGLSDTTMYFVENIAAAFPPPSIHNLVFSRQFEVLALPVIASLIAAAAACSLLSFNAVPGYGRRRQFAFASLTVSVGLIHLGVACGVLAVLIMLGRMGGHELPASDMVPTAVIGLAILLVPITTHLVHRWSRNSPMNGLGIVRSPAPYSAIAPLAVVFMLILIAGWVNDRFKPELTLLLSGHCAQPEKGACVATVKPKDIDGKVALQSISAQLVLGYADEANIVGPRRLATSAVTFDVIQDPDTPLPIQLTTDVEEGVTQKVEFQCPKQFAGRPRKLVIVSSSASAQTRLLEGPSFGNYAFIPVHFAIGGELNQLLRGHPDRCRFFP
ncbi:hypothetical protein M3A49_01125 [Paraburkholderia sp. CNPSo 3076]|uniref:hypothetical protein n=1 Tax=Paraburkholderia sp. CNPSo 3076 TaxID=2940936 RepID=UPI002252F763|nr:hypothetical protein [Paraburkholderia sp. CNPSo 3076]MCX5538110.1 hypothetical protein [Paraburkholderia sp. CNPSo 3076]